MSKSEIVIALEGEALHEFEATVSHRFLERAYSTESSDNATVYRFNNIEWDTNKIKNIGEIDEIIRKLSDEGKKVCLVQLNNDTHESIIVGDNDYFKIKIKSKIEFGDKVFEPGMIIEVNKDYQDLYDDFLIVNPQFKREPFNLKKVTPEEDIEDMPTLSVDNIYFIPMSEIDSEDVGFKKLLKFLGNQNSGFFAVRPGDDDKLESIGRITAGVKSYTHIENGFTGNPDFVIGGNPDIINAIQKEWVSDLDLSDVNRPINSQGRTYIMHAARYGNMEAYQALLEAGASPSQENKFGLDALSEAFLARNDKMVDEVMKDPRININKEFYVDLLTEDMMVKFFDAGFDVNTKNKNGNTIIMVRIDEPDIIQAALKYKGHDFDLKNNAGLSFNELLANHNFPHKRNVQMIYESHMLMASLEEDDSMDLR